MRIDATSSQDLLSSLARLNTQETNIASQLSSGVRLTKLSDDPTAAGQSALLADGIARDDAFLASANTVTNRLQAGDTALSSVVTQLTSAISTAVAAVGGNTTSTNTAVDVSQLTSIRQSLFSLANSSYSGSYLFGGTSTSLPFTQAADGSVTYAGNTATTELQLASGGSVVTSTPGSSIFTATGASVFGALNDLITNLTNGTVDATNSGTLVGALQSALANVSTQRATLNTAQTQVTGESDYTTLQQTSLKAQQSALIAADPASLATELSSATTQRSALLSTLGIIEKGSLFDYLNG
jgi:flagellar hook-associated protein 3 FlgL